ncbi:MAG TPA: hypothetical protein VEA99_04680, partial [Gemmatimonadaceae bacterium]|nr:hypothetical protein [Gemmatimonadaceae bacterium]
RASLEARRVELERTTAKRIEELERTTAKRIEETERNAAKRIDEAEKGAAKRVDETERSFAKQKEELERSFAKRREELERTHAKQKEELERAHARQTQELEKSFTKRNEELERAHAKRSEELESEIARQRQELERATVRQREELAAERQSTERALAKQREEFQRATAKEREEFQRTTTRERQELERAIAKERQELAAARAAMERAFEQERARLQQESARLVAERGRLEQDRADVDAYWARTEARLHDAHPAEGGAEHAPRTSLGATDVGAAALLADAAREREVTRPVDREPPPADDTLDAAGPDTSPAADAEDVDGMPLPPAMLAFAAGRRGGPTAHDEHEHEAAREPERESASDRQLSRSARRKQKRQKWAAAQGKPGPSAADASAAAAVVPPPADRPITTRDTSTDASEPPRADEEEPTPTWRDRARRVFGSRWTIPGAGLFLVAAVGTALAVGGDDEPTEAAARDAARPAASVVDSAAGAVVADAPAAGMTPVPSIVPMPRDYSADLPPTAGLPVPAAGTPRAAVPSRRETSERPSARETPTGWRSSGRTATSTARRAPVERVESPAPPPVATSGGATTGVPDTLIAPITPPPANFLSRIWSSITRTDSGRRDSLARARPDTTPRPDSLRR